MNDGVGRKESVDPAWARFGIIAEIHDAPPGSPPAAWHNPYPPDYAKERLGPALARLQREEVDALVLLGDLTHFGDAETQASVIESVTETGLPVLLAPGNHDVAKEHGGLHRFQESVTIPGVTVAPARLSLSSGVRILLLAIDHDPASGRHRSAFLGQGDIAGDGLLIVFSHFPVLPMAERLEEASFAHAGDLADRAAVADLLLSRNGPTVVVHGHLHVRAVVTEGRVLQLSCAALIEPPHEVALLSVRMSEQGRPEVSRSVAPVAEFEATRVPVLDSERGEWTFTGHQWERGGA